MKNMKDRVLNLIKNEPAFASLYESRKKGTQGYEYNLKFDGCTGETVHFDWMGIYINYNVNTDKIRVYYRGLEKREQAIS